MEELERIEKGKDKLTSFQEAYNVTSKRIANFIGKYLVLLICLAIPMILIGFVWTDIGWPTVSIKMIAEGVVTVALLFVAEVMTTILGSDGGRLDADYLEAKGEFNTLVRKVGEVGTLLLNVFCEWQIDVELERATISRLRSLRLSPEKWGEIKDLTDEELINKYGKKKAAKLREIADLEPIELNESILLFNGKETARGGVPEGADAYLQNRKHTVVVLLACVFTGLLSISFALSLTSDVTLARVIYTAVKLLFVFYRMACGYARGARAYNTVEVRRLKCVCNYLRQYLQFVEEKIYLGLGNKYGDISMFVETSAEAVTLAEESV